MGTDPSRGVPPVRLPAWLSPSRVNRHVLAGSPSVSREASRLLPMAAGFCSYVHRRGTILSTRYGSSMWRRGDERVVVDPKQLGSGDGEQLSVEERARRERMRETAGGIVAYATDQDARIAVFALSGGLFVADLVTGAVRELDVPTPVFDPRPDPTGTQVAFVHGRALYTVRLGGGAVTKLAGEDAEAVSWGVAEFVAAEEMSRERGYWWSPDGQAVLATRVDESPVQEIWITEAADPTARPRAVKYPGAGTPNALVEAHVLKSDGSGSVRVEWDRETYPYLSTGGWDRHGPLISVQSRDQRTVVVLAVDPVSGRPAR